MDGLSDLQLRYLLYLLKNGQLFRNKLATIQRQYSLLQKSLAIDGLLRLNLIKKENKFDTTESKKPRKGQIFYSLTEEGREWLEKFALSEDK